MQRYPGPYPTLIRPGFPPRLPVGVIPQFPRMPVPGIRPISAVISPIMRPAVPNVTPMEKLHTTVYVGKIAPTVDNEFLLSILRLCGPVKEWKRPQDPTDGTPKGYGFCEFETAEGILRGLRLLRKLNVDGQELVLNINQATKDYLEKYVAKKMENEKNRAETATGDNKDSEADSSVEADLEKPLKEESKKDSEDSDDKANQENSQHFGIVTDEDAEADKDAMEKISGMIAERLKSKPLPPPPPPPPPPLVHTSAEGASKDVDSDVDVLKSDGGEDRNAEETGSETKVAADGDKNETASSDRGKRSEKGRDRERDRDRDTKREKEREYERFERERERERIRKERERDQKTRDSERAFKDRLREWESREREREYQRQHEKDREKEKERERRREVFKQEDDSDEDDSRKRKRRSSTYEDKRKRRLREKEDDLLDRLREEKEIVEAKKRAVEEEQARIEKIRTSLAEAHAGMQVEVGEDKKFAVNAEEKEAVIINNYVETAEGAAHTHRDTTADSKQNDAIPNRKLGFGLVASGKRTNMPSVFQVEEDEDPLEKKMRPLIPIDYSTEELHHAQNNSFGPVSDPASASEPAKRGASTKSKDEKLEHENEKHHRRSGDSSRDRNRSSRDSSQERVQGRDGKHKIVDAKQLIDSIPKTKEELFGYEINWSIFDKNELHEKMRPWISKKVTEFLGEDEPTLVDYIVTCTKNHANASEILQILQSILDEEAEMFVLKMWRMLIFEIKRVEIGLPMKPRA